MKGEEQIIGANIDVALIVMASGNDFNLNRLDRYLAITQNANIKPVVLISKVDLLTSNLLDEMNLLLTSKLGGLQFILFSNYSKDGLEAILNLIKPGVTHCVIGSSGVGKSTLLNNLIGDEALAIREISKSTGKGKHTTTHRELYILLEGGIIIDTPGMREIGISTESTGAESSFQQIRDLICQCRFSNCTHMDEPGCAIVDAIDDGFIEESAFDNFMRIEREGKRFQETVSEKQKKDRTLGKMYKEIISFKKRNR